MSSKNVPNILDYGAFESDLDNTIGAFLSKYGFVLVPVVDEAFTRTYQSSFWRIELSMLANFPHIGVSFDFFDLKGRRCRPAVMTKFLEIDQKALSLHYSDFKGKNNSGTYAVEMKYLCEVLARFYEPLLSGKRKTQDYLLFEYCHSL